MMPRFATEPQLMRDEDALEREDFHDDEGNDPDDLDAMYHALCEGDASVARGCLAFAHCLQQMAAAAHHGNLRALEHWYRQCRHVLENMHREGDER
jgi:hypothetical protein